MLKKGLPDRAAVPDSSGAAAEKLAISALGFLAGDAERLDRFLGVTGLGPQNLRAAAADSGFLASVLGYLAEDETLLLAFAAEAGLRPEEAVRAHRALGGPANPGGDI